jgi:hypothetical protein
LPLWIEDDEAADFVLGDTNLSIAEGQYPKRRRSQLHDG